MNTHNNAVPTGTTPGGVDERAMRGQALRDVMEVALSARQMSVSRLARDADVQRGDIYRWWRGDSRPTRNSLARIAAALGMDAAPLRQALGEPPTATERPADIVAAIDALTERLERLEASQVEGFDAVLRALAATLGVPEPKGTRRGSGRASPSGAGG